MSETKSLNSVERFQLPGVITCAGMKYSGKTHLVNRILSELISADKFDHGLIVTPVTAKGEWSIESDKFRVSNSKDGSVDDLIETQKSFWAAGEKTSAFIVFDGSFPREDVTNKTHKFLAAAGRSIGITVVYTVQKFDVYLHPFMRQNANYVLMLRQPSPRAVESLYMEYGAAYGSLQEWKDLLNDRVHDYTALFYDNTSQSNTREVLFDLIKA